MTEKARKSQLMDSGLSTKASIIGKPVILRRLKCDGEESPRGQLKYSDAKLPRKVSMANGIGACTENRHRWARRVS